MNEYEKQAEAFLKETKTEFKAVFLRHGKHFEDDKDKRDIYEITLKRGDRAYKFPFGQSIVNSGFKLINTNTNQETKYTWFKELTYNTDRDGKRLTRDIKDKIGSLGCFKIVLGTAPSAYDVLACLEKNEVGSFSEFCDEFGYDTDSRKAETTYKAVLNEYENLKMLYSDEELSKMQEIQ